MTEALDSLVEFSVSGVQGESRVSVSESGRVGDIVEAVYEDIWKYLSDEEFEERWTSRCMTLFCTGSTEFMRGDIPIMELFAEDCEAKPTDLIGGRHGTIVAHSNDFVGTWSYNSAQNGVQSYTIVVNSSGDLYFEEALREGNVMGTLFVEGDWLVSTLRKSDDHWGFIRLQLEGVQLLSNFKVQEEDVWGANILANKQHREVLCPADFGAVDTDFPSCGFAQDAAMRAHRRALKENALDGMFALSYILRPASDKEIQRRKRLSRIRQAKLKRNAKLLPVGKDLSNTPFKRGLIARVAQRLKQLERRKRPVMYGHHEVTYQKGELVWTEQDWSWTLLYSGDRFIWRHERCRSDDRREDVLSSEDQFIDFWTRLSEQTTCVYSSLLLYKDEKDAVQLNGAPRLSDFLRFVTG